MSAGKSGKKLRRSLRTPTKFITAGILHSSWMSAKLLKEFFDVPSQELLWIHFWYMGTMYPKKDLMGLQIEENI